MHVALQGIGLLAPGLEGWRRAVQCWPAREPFVPCRVPDPEAALLPPNERRRSSDCVRWAVHVAQEAIAQSGLDPRDVATVFASSGGEMGVLDHSAGAWRRPERVISPTLFHQSVHNTAAGYWGIATTCQQSSTALSCYDDSFARRLARGRHLRLRRSTSGAPRGLRLGLAVPLYEARPIQTVCRRARADAAGRLLARRLNLASRRSIGRINGWRNRWNACA